MGKGSMNAWDEMAAALLGLQRRAASSSLTKRTGYGGTTSVIMDVAGAVAERWFAEQIGVPWVPSVNTFGPDVGPYYVKWTSYQSGHLIVRETDPDDAPCVLIVGWYPKLRIAGWITAGDGKQLHYRNGNAWHVPQEDLLKTVRENRGASAH